MQNTQTKLSKRQLSRQSHKKEILIKFGLALSSLALVLMLSNCKPKTEAKLEIKARLQDQAQLKIDLNLAPHLHLYLDKGDRGNLIPVSFDWQSLLTKGFLKRAPKLISAPKGEYDKDMEAKVLRAQGSFLFSLSENDTSPQGVAGQTLRIRTQLCNELDGICYRPEWTDVQILP